jgi:hypothetical protein
VNEWKSPLPLDLRFVPWRLGPGANSHLKGRVVNGRKGFVCNERFAGGGEQVIPRQTTARRKANHDAFVGYIDRLGAK